MIVGYGDNNVLLIAITEDEIADLRTGRTLTYEGVKMLTKDIIVLYGRDKEHVIAQLAEAGVSFSGDMIEKYRRGERTDKPRRAS